MVSVSELIELVLEDYAANGKRTAKAVRARRVHLERLLPDLPTSRDINRYTVARRTEGAAPSSIRNELSVLRRGFRLAMRFELVGTAPTIEFPRVENVRTVVPTWDQLAAILRTLDWLRPAVADAVRWAVLTGWRREQIFGLTWAEVLSDRSAVNVPGTRTKNRRPHAIVLGSAARELVEHRWHVRSGEYVFQDRGRRIHHFRGPWRRATAAAGIPELRFHDLRRAFVQLAEDAGVSAMAQLAIAGWRTDSARRRYGVRPSALTAGGLDAIATHAFRVIGPDASKAPIS